MKTTVIATMGLSLLLGCGGASKPPAAPSVPVAPSATATATSAKSSTERAPVGTSLTVTDDIYRLCHLDVPGDDQAAPKFAFDQSLLSRADALVLEKIATCLTTGPLSGRHVQLTGRADPRGTEEYNMSLGARRAHAVATYLEQLKVQGAQIDETSRGALDATGTSEQAWARDRRVDIALMPR